MLFVRNPFGPGEQNSGRFSAFSGEFVLHVSPTPTLLLLSVLQGEPGFKFGSGSELLTLP